MDDMLSVKRIAIEPQGKRVSVLSDNPTFPSWPGLEKRALNIVGRVLWFGRALR
jgi:phage repressor protein C with HTH and peptisase S24 domain